MADIKVTSTSQIAATSDDSVFRLKRGEQVNLTRIDPALKQVHVGVGWDVVGFDTEAPDLDCSVFLLDKKNKTRRDEDFVFYNNAKSDDGCVEHLGDNRTGAGDGDDETIRVKLDDVPYDVHHIIFVISIYDAGVRGHTFKNVRNCFLRIVNEDTKIELMRFNLDVEFESAPKATAVIVGSLMREGQNWFFDGIGTMEDGGLPKIATDYGITVAT